VRGELTRRRLLRTGLGALTALGLTPGSAFARDSRGPTATGLSVRGSAQRYAGDRPMFVTVAPGVENRDAASVLFQLERRARVRLDAVRTGIGGGSDVRWSKESTLGRGAHELVWRPAADTPVGSYVMRLTVDGEGRRRIYGGRRPPNPARAGAPVVRVLGVEAAFSQRSYLPTEPMALRVLADTPSFTLTFLRVGHGPDPTLRGDELVGLEMGAPVQIDWTGKRSARRTIVLQSGDWPSGLYAARLTTPDGRVGFAPFVLRPKSPGGTRVAVVLPTNTWQAYNLYDADGDGWGDTWYAGGAPPVLLDRPYRDRGVPPRFRRYDFPFLRWLEKTRREPDVFADDDLETFTSGDQLRSLYDLVVFPGHSEYVSQHAYDIVQRFRDLGGRLVFLSANNFFWRVDKRGEELRRVAQWRALARPEAMLCGVQYRANDDGTRQAPFTVVDMEAAPWLFEGTGLENGDTLGDEVGGFGIEIDMRTGVSPPETRVIAQIPDLFGPGLDAEMAYYELPSGARVFAAGVLDFPAVLYTGVGMHMLDNLWRHMTEDAASKELPPLPPSPPPPG
jgi:N,N-dimethylformamidase beta subunit-like, C-terminal